MGFDPKRVRKLLKYFQTSLKTHSARTSAVNSAHTITNVAIIFHSRRDI
jgi:hypothetical protein